MAFGKSSNKNTKAASEAPSKFKTATAATKVKTAVEKPLKEVASLVAPKSSRKAPEVVAAPLAVTTAPKTMAAAAGHTEHSSAHVISSDPLPTGEILNGAHTSNGVTRDEIAQRAYLYFAERGFAHGYADEDWTRAEADLKK